MSFKHLAAGIRPNSVFLAANYSMYIIPKPLNAGKMATGSSYLIIIILHKMSRKPRFTVRPAGTVGGKCPGVTEPRAWCCPRKPAGTMRWLRDAGEEDAGGPLPLCRVGMMVCPPNNAHAHGHESCLAPFSPPQLHAHCSAGR